MKVVHIRDTHDVYGGRPRGGKRPQDCRPGVEEGWLGNPYPLTDEAHRAECIARFKSYFWQRINSDAAYRTAVLALRGRTIACFCHPKACHLDVIVDWFKAGCPMKEGVP